MSARGRRPRSKLDYHGAMLRRPLLLLAQTFPVTWPNQSNAAREVPQAAEAPRNAAKPPPAASAGEPSDAPHDASAATKREPEPRPAEQPAADAPSGDRPPRELAPLLEAHN